LQDPPLGRGLFACFRERHVKKCSRYHQEWSRGYKNSHIADVGCRSGLYSGRGPKSAIAEISTRGRARAALEIGNCRNQHQGSHEGCARNRQLPKSAPGLEERTKTLVHRVMLQPQGFSGNYRTYCRFSTPTLKRNLPKLGRGQKSAIGHTFVRGPYSRRRFQPKRIK